MEMVNKAARKLKSTLGGMGIPELASSLAADYTKRYMESKYDDLAKTRLFKKLKDRSDKEKYFIEFAFYFFNAFLKHATNESTPLRAYFREIATDFFPEMGKRLINGDTPEGREVIDMAYDTNSKTYAYASPKQNQPGFAAGFMSVIDERMKKSTQKK